MGSNRFELGPHRVRKGRADDTWDDMSRPMGGDEPPGPHTPGAFEVGGVEAMFTSLERIS
eukprot:6800703-Prymnesium_polylepis.1